MVNLSQTTWVSWLVLEGGRCTGNLLSVQEVSSCVFVQKLAGNPNPYLHGKTMNKHLAKYSPNCSKTATSNTFGHVFVHFCLVCKGWGSQSILQLWPKTPTKEIGGGGGLFV